MYFNIYDNKEDVSKYVEEWALEVNKVVRIGKEHIDDEFWVNFYKELSFLHDWLVNTKVRIEYFKNQVKTLYTKCMEVIYLIDISTIDEEKHWRSNEEVTKSLKEFLEKKLKAPKSWDSAMNMYECYLSWIAQVKISHKRIRNWAIGKNIFQYQGFWEGRDQVSKLVGEDIKAKVA